MSYFCETSYSYVMNKFVVYVIMNKVFYGHILIMNKLFLLILDNGLMRIYKVSKVPLNYPCLIMICNTIVLCKYFMFYACDGFIKMKSKCVFDTWSFTHVIHVSFIWNEKASCKSEENIKYWVLYMLIHDIS